MKQELVKSEPKNEIVVCQPNETMRLEVRVADESVWLSQAKIGELFGVDRTVINRHIHNIYKTGELDESATCAKIAQVQNEGGRQIARVIPIVDNTVWHIGASLKDAGSALFAMMRMELDPAVILGLLP